MSEQGYIVKTPQGGFRTFTLEQLNEAQYFAVENNVEVEDYTAPEPGVFVPQQVTPRQMRVALIMSGISIASIEAMIDALEEPQKSIVRTTWEYSTAFERDNEILNQMASMLGLSQPQVDDLFLLARTL